MFMNISIKNIHCNVLPPNNVFFISSAYVISIKSNICAINDNPTKIAIIIDILRDISNTDLLNFKCNL